MANAATDQERLDLHPQPNAGEDGGLRRHAKQNVRQHRAGSARHARRAR
jgi:hypothetical protein